MKIIKNRIAMYSILVVGGLLLAGCWGTIHPSETPAKLAPSPTVLLKIEVKKTAAPKPSATALTVNSTQPAAASSTPTTSLQPSWPEVLENTALPEVDETITLENIGRVGPLARWGKGRLETAVYSPDGKWIGLATSLGVYLYTSQDLVLVRFYPSDGIISALEFAPDQKTFAWGYADGRVEIRKVQDGAAALTLESGLERVDRLIYWENGQKLTAIYKDPIGLSLLELVDWDINSGQIISSGKVDFGDISSNTHQIASLNYKNGKIEVFDELSGDAQLSLPYEESVYFLHFSQNGKNILFANWEGNTFLINIDHPENILKLSDVPKSITEYLADDCERHVDGIEPGPVNSAAFSPDGKIFLLGTQTRAVQIRRVLDGVVLSSYEGMAEDLVFAPDGQTFLALPGDGTLEIRLVNGGVMIKQLSGFTNGFTSAAFSPDGKLLAAGASDELVRVWRVKEGQQALALQTQANRVAFSPDGVFLATGSRFGGVNQWNLSSGKHLELVKDNSKVNSIRRINSLLYTPDGATLMSGSQACFLQIWDTLTGETRWKLFNERGPNEGNGILREPVINLLASPDGQKIIVSDLQDVRILDIKSKEILKNFPTAGSENFIEMAFLPKTNRFVAAGVEAIELWELDPIKIAFKIEANMQTLAVSPDETLLASSDEEGTIYLWRVEDGKTLGKLSGHRGKITQLVFSADGKLLVSSSEDGTLRLWGVR